MADFSGSTYGAVRKWTKKFMGITGMKVGTVTNGDSFPTIRPSGNPLVADDYVQPASSSTFPFDIVYNSHTVTFTNENDKAFWTGSTWTLQAGATVETNEVNVKNKAAESYSGEKEYQNDVNKEFVDEIKSIIKDSTDLDSIATDKIEQRPYFQTTDTTARKSGIYWYNKNSTKTDKWEKMGGGGIDDGDEFPSTATENDWFYLKTDVTVGTDTYIVGVYRYDGTKWIYIFGSQDLTDDLETLNESTLEFAEGTSLVKIGKRFNLAGELTLKTPVTDTQSTERKIADLPDECDTTGICFAEITTQEGNHTSEETRKEFYDAGGGHYLDPESFKTKLVQVEGCADIRTIYSKNTYTETETQVAKEYTHNPTTDKWYYGTTEISVTIVTEVPDYFEQDYLVIASELRIYKNEGYKAPQRINDSTYALMFNDDGTPDFEHTVLSIDSNTTQNAFRLHLPKTEVGNEYKKVKDESGMLVYKYVPFYQMDRIPLKTNADFLYQYQLMQNGCKVDTTGKFCDVSYTETDESTKYTKSQPFDGTVTWTPRTYESDTNVGFLNVHDKGLYVRGDTSIKKITLGGTF